MNHLFVPYELAVKLKEKNCLLENYFGGWGNNKKWYWHPDSDITLDAPLYQQVVDWLREKHDLNIGMNYFKIGTVSYWEYRIHYKDIYGQGGEYYNALTKAIEEALKLINK